MSDIDWHGVGWRLWRVDRPSGFLRNPWTNTGQRVLWEPGEVQTASCIWRRPDGSPRCNGYLKASCTCGIRSMTTLPALAAFLASDRQLTRHPDKAAVVGTVRIGGKVQHRIPGLPAVKGYQRSEFAQIDGALFVSPIAARLYESLAATYQAARVHVIDPGFVGGSDGQQDWLERLARTLAAHGTSV